MENSIIKPKLTSGHDVAAVIRISYNLDKVLAYCNYNSDKNIVEIKRIAKYESSSLKYWMLDQKVIYIPFTYNKYCIRFTK